MQPNCESSAKAERIHSHIMFVSSSFVSPTQGKRKEIRSLFQIDDPVEQNRESSTKALKSTCPHKVKRVAAKASRDSFQKWFLSRGCFLPGFRRCSNGEPPKKTCVFSLWFCVCYHDCQFLGLASPVCGLKRLGDDCFRVF